MVAALVTLWKPYMAGFVVIGGQMGYTSVSGKLSRDSEFLGNGIMPDAIYPQDLILLSSCITPTLTLCPPFGRKSILEYFEVGPAERGTIHYRCGCIRRSQYWYVKRPTYITSWCSQRLQILRPSGTRKHRTEIHYKLRRLRISITHTLNLMISTQVIRMLSGPPSGNTSTNSMAVADHPPRS